MLIRSLYAAFGVLILGFGAALLLSSGLGLDPFTALNSGVANLVGVPLGTAQLAMNILLFIAVWIFGRDQIGPGTIINMVCTGYLISFFHGLLGRWVPTDPSAAGQAVLFVAGLIAFDFGASAYICAGAGTAPYDALAPIIVNRTHWKYSEVRGVQDLACIGMAVLVRGQVGISTIVTAFFNGPLIQHYSEAVNRGAVERLLRLSGSVNTGDTAQTR